MPFVLNFIQKTERLNVFLGQGAAWLLPVMAILSFLIAVLRYVFDIGWVWSQELLLYMHGAFFMLGMAYTLFKEDHVRVDIFYRDMKPRRQALVDFIGSLGLLAPFCLLFLIHAIPYVWDSWKHLEDSPQAGGLPFVYLLKTLLIIMPLTLLMQGFSLALKSALLLFGKDFSPRLERKRGK